MLQMIYWPIQHIPLVHMGNICNFYSTFEVFATFTTFVIFWQLFHFLKFCKNMLQQLFLSIEHIHTCTKYLQISSKQLSDNFFKFYNFCRFAQITWWFSTFRGSKYGMQTKKGIVWFEISTSCLVYAIGYLSPTTTL